MDLITLALAKSHVAKTADSLGSLKGAPCTISKIEETDDGSIVTYQWTGTSGAIETRTMTVKNGVDGVGIQSIVRDNANNKVIYTMTDGTRHTVNDIEVEAVDVSYTNTEDTTVKNTKTALDKLFDKVDGTLSEDLTANVAMGNVTVGRTFTKGTNLEDVIREMLTQYIKPVVNLLLNPSTTLYNEITDTVESITLNATVTKKTSDIAKIEFFVNNSLVHTITSNVADGGTFTYIYRPSTPINDDTSFRVVVTDVEGGEGTMSKNITFISESYYGILDANTSEVTESMAKTLNKTLKNTNKLVYDNINTDWGKICYCYPAELSELKSIKDEINSISYINSFSKSTITISGVPFYCYLQIDPSAATNVCITFA